MSLYPNPASEKATIAFFSNRNSNYVMRVVDVIGQVLISERISAVEGYNEKEINLEKVSKGLYVVFVQAEGGEIKSLRLIVE